jgi:hypothetical protein
LRKKTREGRFSTANLPLLFEDLRLIALKRTITFGNRTIPFAERNITFGKRTITFAESNSPFRGF